MHTNDYKKSVPFWDGFYFVFNSCFHNFQLEDSGSNFIFTLIKNKKLKETYNTVGFIETYYIERDKAMKYE
ncbi:hypothetical protein RM51_00935 [Chryseobacterium taiwanense]|uniref:Uncharacterized protein n=1 Tax=Chryseobacterium taiwanense TaxID=363331 RepID=A0A0B4DE96_9FLAO|nr:hypothetical protein RM51_00935 [Chryseobacterium taiwanense]